MIGITSNGVHLAMLQRQLLADDINRVAFLEQTFSLGIWASEAAAVADKFSGNDCRTASFI